MPRAKKTTAVIEETTELPTELKASLDSLSVNETFMKLEDNLECALKVAAEELYRIDERADFAINVITQSIKTRAAVEKGRVLLTLKDKYHGISGFDGTFKDWLATVKLTERQAQRLMNTAKVVEETTGVFEEDTLMNLSYGTLDAVHRLPSDSKIEVLEKVESGEKVTQKSVEAELKKPEVKLSKAEELLAHARAKRDEAVVTFEEVKADPEVTYSDKEYKAAAVDAANAKRRVEDLEEQAELLRKQLTEQTAKAASEAKARQIAENELEALKFDDHAARQQRVKRIQSTLTIQIPQVMSDIQKYLAEREHYEEAYQEALNTLVQDLKSYLQEHV